MSPENETNESQRPGLLPREKLTVFLLLFILTTIASFSFAAKHQKISLLRKSLHVHCVGAITNEQWLDVPAGSQVADLLVRLSFREDADPSKLVLEERIKNNQIFVVPTKGKTTLYVQGAVKEPGIVYVPAGCRFNQLKAYLELTDEADMGIFRRRRRRLIDGETVHIPARSEQLARNEL